MQQIGELLSVRRTDGCQTQSASGNEIPGEVLDDGVASSNGLFTHQSRQLNARLSELLAEEIVEEQIGRGVDRLKEIHRGVEQTSRTAVVEENAPGGLRTDVGVEQRRGERQFRFEDVIDEHRKATDEEEQHDADEHQSDVAFVLFVVLSGEGRIQAQMSTTIQVELLQQSHGKEIDQDQQKKRNGVDHRNVEPNVNDATKDFVLPDRGH